MCIRDREKKDSSLTQGLNLLKNGEGDAFVSAGSTGALLDVYKRQLSACGRWGGDLLNAAAGRRSPDSGK